MVALIATAVCLLMPAASQAAASSVSEQAARDAATLAGRIEALARHGSPDWRSVIRVNGCCGVRTVEVRARARMNSQGQYGSYFLLVVKQPGGIAKVSLLEGVTKRFAYREHEPHYDLLYQFALSAQHVPGRPGPWQLGTTYPLENNVGGTVTASTGGHGYHLTLAELGTLYGQALQVLAKAEQHKPVGQEAYLWPPSL